MTLCLGPTWAHNWSYVSTFGAFGASKLDCFSCDQLEKKKKKKKKKKRRVAAGGMADEGDAQKNKKKLKLYSYWGSSCSCRVRIALNLKGLEYEYVPVNVLKGEQYSPDFLKLNPIGYVPALVDGDVVLADSFAILMYLEEKYPQHPLLPADLNKKAINFQAATIVSSSIQPVQNLAYQKYVEERMSLCDRVEWVKHHIGKGFSALENLLKEHAGKYATGNEICLADVFLAPQIHVAIKIFNLDMSQYPLLSKLNEAYMELPAFQHAMPENQPDTPLSTA